MLYCLYYQAQISKKNCRIAVALFRSVDYIAFDRTLDKANSIFEFFVPECNKDLFLETMQGLQALGMINDLKQLDNRLQYQNYL